MKYQSGDLVSPKETDPTFETYSEAFAHVKYDSLLRPQGIWSSQADGSELLAIIWDREAYKQ
jgi:hypothetical protein